MSRVSTLLEIQQKGLARVPIMAVSWNISTLLEIQPVEYVDKVNAAVAACVSTLLEIQPSTAGWRRPAPTVAVSTLLEIQLYIEFDLLDSRSEHFTFQPFLRFNAEMRLIGAEPAKEDGFNPS